MENFHRYAAAPAFFALDLVVSMALSLILFALLTTTLKHTVVIDYRVRKKAAEDYALMRAEHALASAINNLDSHRLAIPPRLHENGQVTFTDGSINPVMHTNREIRPDAGSTAITTLELAPLSAFKIVSCTPSSGELRMEACLNETENTFSSSETHGFVGLSSEDLRELQGKVSGNGRCRSFTLRAVRSMSLSSHQPASCRFAKLLPIVNHYTLYLDASKQLRHLAHEGQENIENQPVVRLPENIALDLELIAKKGCFTMEAAFRRTGKSFQTFHFTNHLSRTLPFNFVFNL